MIPNVRQIHTKLYIGSSDGITWLDLSDHFVRAAVNKGDVTQLGASGVDGVIASADFSLRRRGPVYTLDPGSSPILFPNCEIMLRVAITAPGVEPSSWVTLFHGLLGDSISYSDTTVDLTCRDMAKLLGDCYIEEVQQYGSDEGAPLETVLQQIIDANLGVGEALVYCPVSPGFMVTPYQVEHKSVWDAIQEAVGQAGCFIGYRWDPNTTQYRLTLLEVPRDKDASTADFALTWTDDIYVEQLDISDKDIRNVVKVTWRDKVTGQRRSVTVADELSIAQFRRRAMQIEEADTSLIDTEAEARRLADAALADLSQLTSTNRIEMPLLPELDIMHGITVTNPRMSEDQTFYGVESVRHTIDYGSNKFRTEVIASGRVIGGHNRWLRMQTRPGSPGEPDYPLPITDIPPDTPAWDTCEFVRDVTLRWHPVARAVEYEIRRVDADWGTELGRVWHGTETTAVIAPQSRSETFYLRARDAGGRYSQISAVKTLTNATPSTPAPPVVTEFFSALWITINPVADNDIVSYNLYMTPVDDGGDPTGDTQVTTYLSAGRITYNASPGTRFRVEVAAADVLGEGGKSAPIYASTNALDKLDIPEDIIEPSHLTEELRQDISAGVGAADQLDEFEGRMVEVEQIVDEQNGAITSLVGTVEQVGESVAQHTSQIQQLSNEITLKVQVRQDGKLVIAGIGMAVDEDGQSEVAMLADRFRVLTSVDGEMKSVFAVDTGTGKVYVLGDLIATGLIRATEVQAEVAKHLLLAAQVATVDHLGALKIEAGAITVGGSAPGIPLTKPEGALLCPFNGSFMSTNGISPVGTPVATLRPDGRFGGAVAVEIGRTNIIVDGSFENGISDWGAYVNGTVTHSSDYAYDGQYSLKYTASDTGTWGSGVVAHIAGYAGKTLTLSWKIKAVGSAIGKRVYAEIFDTVSGSTSGTRITLDGTWQTITVTKTIDPTATAIYVYFIGNFDAGNTVYADCCMCEEGSFPTSFVNGTRAPGYLEYKVTYGDRGLLRWQMTGSGKPLDPNGTAIFNLNPGASSDKRNDIWQATSASLGTPGAGQVVWINTSGGWSPLTCELSIDPDDWLDCVITWNKTTKLRTLTVHNLTKGVSNSVSANDADTLVFGDRLLYGAGSYLANVRYDEVMLWHQDATPEQIAAWHNMGAPFVDPQEQIGDERIPSASRWDAGIAETLSELADLSSEVSAKVTIFYQPDQPTAKAIGDIWYDTDADPVAIHRWNGSQWIDITTTALSAALAAAGDAQATADGKIKTYYQASAPTTGMSVGDLWVDTDDGNRLYRYSGTQWVDVADKTPINADQRQISAVGGKYLITQDGATQYDGSGVRRVHTGHLGGLEWGNTVLPAGTYGQWGDAAGLYFRGYPKVLYVSPKISLPYHGFGYTPGTEVHIFDEDAFLFDQSLDGMLLPKGRTINALITTDLVNCQGDSNKLAVIRMQALSARVRSNLSDYRQLLPYTPDQDAVLSDFRVVVDTFIFLYDSTAFSYSVRFQVILISTDSNATLLSGNLIA